MDYSRASWTRFDRRAEELLITCMKKDAVGSRAREIAGLIRSGADLRAAGNMAAAKGVSWLAYRALIFFTPSDDKGREAMRALQVSCGTSSVANEYYKEELKRVLRYFSERGIAVIPLKGIALAERLYGDVAARDRSVDTDLLVKEKDRERGAAALKELGYIPAYAGETEAYEWCRTFHNPKKNMIELHWDITMMVRSPERIEGLWRGARPRQWEGVSFYDLEPAELLLYLAAHLVNSDSFRHLKYLCDIDRLIGKYGNEIEWDSLIAKAVEWRLSGSLYTALKVTGDILGTDFPEDELRRLRVSFPKKIFIRAFAGRSVVFRSRVRRRILDKFLSYILFEIMEANSLKDHVNIFKRVLFPPREMMENRTYFGRFCNGVRRLFNKDV